MGLPRFWLRALASHRLLVAGSCSLQRMPRVWVRRHNYSGLTYLRDENELIWKEHPSVMRSRENATKWCFWSGTRGRSFGEEGDPPGTNQGWHLPSNGPDRPRFFLSLNLLFMRHSKLPRFPSIVATSTLIVVATPDEQVPTRAT